MSNPALGVGLDSLAELVRTPAPSHLNPPAQSSPALAPASAGPVTTAAGGHGSLVTEAQGLGLLELAAGAQGEPAAGTSCGNLVKVMLTQGGSSGRFLDAHGFCF